VVFFSYAVKKVHNRRRGRKGEKITARAPEPIPQYIVENWPNITDCYRIPLSDCRFRANLGKASPSASEVNELRLKYRIIRIETGLFDSFCINRIHSNKKETTRYFLRLNDTDGWE
jgi:hypothetical protein